MPKDAGTRTRSQAGRLSRLVIKLADRLVDDNSTAMSINARIQIG